MVARFAVLGAGSWGTALAQLLARRGHQVRLWTRNIDLLAALQKTRQNPVYHPGVSLHPDLEFTGDMATAVSETSFVVLGVPTPATRITLTEARAALPRDAVVISTAKGIEVETLETPASIAKDILSEARTRQYYGVLSGPSFAQDVIHGIPTAVTVAAFQSDTARKVQEAMHSEAFQIFATDDVVGVELAGALKNVIAIAAGAADGLGFGLSARAALITRGLAEMARIGARKGANPLTFAGLAGLGDLVLTATGDLSRNRRVGLKLAQGKSLKTVLKELGQTAEGIRTAKAAYRLAKSIQVEVPILTEIYRALYERKPLEQTIKDLLSRAPEQERG